MFFQEARAHSHSSPALVVLVGAALTAAVLAVAIQTVSITAGGVDRPVPRVATKAAPIAAPEAMKSYYASRSCWRRRFGCGQSAPSASISIPSTSHYVSRSCWRRKFGCDHGRSSGGQAATPVSGSR
jgi:hypothetical protein